MDCNIRVAEVLDIYFVQSTISIEIMHVLIVNFVILN